MLPARPPAHWVKIRKKVPFEVKQHIQNGILRGHFTPQDLVPLWEWFDHVPYAPPGEGPDGAGTPRPHGMKGARKGDWYVVFPKFILVGNGDMPQSLLEGRMAPWGLCLDNFSRSFPWKKAKLLQAALPPIEEDEKWAADRLAKVRARLLQRRQFSDMEFAAVLTAAFGYRVEAHFRGDPVEATTPAADMSNGAHYDPANENDPIVLWFRPGTAARLTEILRAGKDADWQAFASKVVGTLVHEKTHDYQFGRMRQQKNEQDPTGKAWDQQLDRLESTYPRHRDQYIEYLSNEVEIAAMARQTVLALRHQGMNDKEIFLRLKTRSLRGELCRRNVTFNNYAYIGKHNGPEGAKVFRKFITNMLRALPEGGHQPVSREEYELGEQLSPSRFPKPQAPSPVQVKHRLVSAGLSAKYAQAALRAIAAATALHKIPREQFFRDNEKCSLNPVLYTDLKSAREGQMIGRVGDYLIGKPLRDLYAPVLRVPIRALSTMVEKGKRIEREDVIFHGAVGTVAGVPTIFMNPKGNDRMMTFFHEAAHAMRVAAGRKDEKQNGATMDPDEYKNLPAEQLADKMAEHAIELIRYNPEWEHMAAVFSAVDKGIEPYKGWEQDYPQIKEVMERDKGKKVTAAKSEFTLFDSVAEAKREFLHGACHALTLALHQKLGWPCVLFNGDEGPFHSAVKASDGRFLDAAGLSTHAQIDKRYGYVSSNVDDVPPDAVDALYGVDEWELEDALKYAEVLAKRLKLPTKTAASEETEAWLRYPEAEIPDGSIVLVQSKDEAQNRAVVTNRHGGEPRQVRLDRVFYTPNNHGISRDLDHKIATATSRRIIGSVGYYLIDPKLYEQFSAIRNTPVIVDPDLERRDGARGTCRYYPGSRLCAITLGSTADDQVFYHEMVHADRYAKGREMGEKDQREDSAESGQEYYAKRVNRTFDKPQREVKAKLLRPPIPFSDLEFRITNGAAMFDIVTERPGPPTEDRYVGGCSVYRTRYQGEKAYRLRYIGVISEWRGTGLGQTLYDKAIAEARRRGAKFFLSDDQRQDTDEKAWGRLRLRYPVSFDEKLNRYVITLGADTHLAANTAEAPAQDQDWMGKPGDITETPTFKAWFGDSKVVDDHGRPLLLHHGTTHADKILEHGFKPGWTFLTDARTVADSYQAWDRGGSPKTLDVFARAVNPAYYDAEGKKYTDIGNKVFRVTSDAERKGHDALIIRNIRDNFDSSVPTKPHTTVVVFSPTQIKSATDNSGDFNPSDNRITASQAVTKTNRVIGYYPGKLAAEPQLVNYNAIVREMMPVLKPGLPVPEIKIVNSKTDWLGRCIWQYGRRPDGSTWAGDNTTIELQKSIISDEQTTRRIIAHELAHHEDDLVNRRPELLRLGFHTYQMMRKIRRDGHGPSWQAIAARFNAKYGADFVTKTSDESYVQDSGPVRPFFVLLNRHRGQLRWSHADMLSTKMRKALAERATLVADGKADFRLVMSTDPFFKRNTPLIGSGSLTLARNEEEKAKAEQLWAQPDILAQYISPHDPDQGPYFVLMGVYLRGKLAWQHAKTITPKMKQYLARLHNDRLFQTSDPFFLDSPKIAPNLTPRFARDEEQQARAQKLWDEGENLLPQYSSQPVKAKLLIAAIPEQLHTPERPLTREYDTVRRVYQWYRDNGVEQLPWGQFQKQFPFAQNSPLFTGIRGNRPRVTSEDLANWLEKHTETSSPDYYGVSYDRYHEGDHSFRDVEQLVLQINQGAQASEALADDPVIERYIEMVRQSSQMSGHPSRMDTVGWLRVDFVDEDYLLVDEVQSDLVNSVTQAKTIVESNTFQEFMGKIESEKIREMIQERGITSGTFSSVRRQFIGMGFTADKLEAIRRTLIELFEDWTEYAMSTLLEIARRHGIKHVALHTVDSIASRDEAVDRTKVKMFYDNLAKSFGFKQQELNVGPMRGKFWVRTAKARLLQKESAESTFPASEPEVTGMGSKQASSVRAYHGTTSGGFDTFQPHIRKGEQLGFGIHFAAEKSLAERYAYDDATRRRGKTPMVYTVDLTMNRPLRAAAIVREGSDEFALAQKLTRNKLMTNKDENGVRCAWMQNAIDATSPQRAERLIREAGYDGVIYEAVVGGRVNPSTNTRSVSARGESYLVFEPSQVRVVSTETEPQA